MQGGDVMVPGSVVDKSVEKKLGKFQTITVPSGKNYLRMVVRACI
jgi:hypothetical protein